MRRSRVAQAGLVVSVGIGATRLRRPQSVTPPATDCGLAPALCPPLRRIGLALEPPPLRRRPDLALELCLRDGVSASVWCRVPRDSVSTPLWGHDLCPGAALRRCTPTGDHDSRPGATTLALVPRPRYGVSASLWCRVSRFWAVIPPRHAMVRAVLCWRRLRDPLQASTPPGSGLFCRKTGLNLTLFRGSGRLFRFLAAIRVDGYGITPGQKHSHRRCPVPQPTKPPRTLLRR